VFNTPSPNPKVVLFHEIIWNNIVKPRQTTDGSIIRRMRIACWITKATDTHSALFFHGNMNYANAP